MNSIQDYSVMLNRLRKERMRLNLSQEQLGQQIGMSGNHYGKAEIGTRYFTHSELKLLFITEIDMHYVFTGMSGSKQYAELLRDLSYNSLLDILQLLPIISDLYRHSGMATRKNNSEYRSFGCLPILYGNRKSLFWAYRKWLDLTQKEMAEKFGIEIKTYCKLEKKRSLPNSYIVYTFYQMSLLPPAFLIESESGMRLTISSFLTSLDQCTRNAFIKFITGQ